MNRYMTLGLSMLAGAALGATAIQALHARIIGLRGSAWYFRSYALCQRLLFLRDPSKGMKLRGITGENKTEESAWNGGNQPGPPVRMVPFV
jgi:hypothetical protein